MTTIVTDGKSMAADRLGIWADRPVATTKIKRVGDEIIGISGCHAFGHRLIAWYKKGADYGSFPNNAPDSWQMIILGKDGIKVALKYGMTKIDLKYVAVGSGQDFAISAAYLGKSMKEAIEFASKHDAYTGMGVDVLYLDTKQEN